MDDLFIRQLQTSGYKITAPRRAVFTFLQRSGPTRSQDVATQLVGVIDRTSTYRTLRLFRQLRVIHELILGGHKVVELTDRFSHHHHHLTCLQCDETQTIADDQLEAVLRRVVTAHEFEAQGHLIEVQGRCKACAAAGAAAS